jgi:hypothetical protein
MANDLLIKKRIEVVKNRMLQILRQLANDYERGTIKSPAELQHRVYRELNNFYESIGTPTFKQIKAWGPPYSADHNKMLQQVLTDINTMYEEIVHLTDDLSSNFEQVEMERQSFSKRIIDIETLLGQVRSAFTGRTDVTIFREDFTNVDRYNQDAVNGTPAYLSTDDQLLTLNRTDGELFNAFATVTIIKGDGMPGNTHIVRSSADTLRFDGEEEMHLNMAHILDNNADTWFEYETFELTQQAIDTTGGKDFRYNEPIKWIQTDLKEMRCVIQIDLPKAKVMNWISITPYIPSDRGALPAIIEKIVVSDEKGTYKGMGFEERFSTGKAFIFPRQLCKTITVYLRQDVAYETQVGHMYFMEVNKEEVSVMDKDRQFDGVRVYSPSLPSVENIGVTYDTGTKEIVYPITKYGDTINNEDVKKKNLFVVPATSDRVLAGVEQVPAYRYVIGMRDAELASYQFGAVSQYVSQPYISSTPISQIELDTKYEVPITFPQDEDWVTFYISIDNGSKWYPIYPKNLPRLDVKTCYRFNSGTPKEGRLEEVEYIEAPTDVYEVIVRIDLKRPFDIVDADYYTPVIYNYELQAITAEEVV